MRSWSHLWSRRDHKQFSSAWSKGAPPKGQQEPCLQAVVPFHRQGGAATIPAVPPPPTEDKKAKKTFIQECCGPSRLAELGSRPAWTRTVLGTLTRVSTMLDLLFRSVFTMWNTSMMFCCWIISHTLQMAQKVPLRPPPFLNTEGRVSQTPSWVPHRHGGVATLAKARCGIFCG